MIARSDDRAGHAVKALPPLRLVLHHLPSWDPPESTPGESRHPGWVYGNA